MEIKTKDLQSKVLNKSKKKPVVVQFHAPWCGPCRALKPVITQVHKESPQDWELIFVNVQNEPLIASQFNVFTIPEVKLFQNGEVTASFTGFKSAHVIQNWLDRNLEKTKETKFTPIENQLSAKEIEQVKEKLLDLAVQENPQSEYLTLLMALQHFETNNNEALQWLMKIGDDSPLNPLAKRLRDLIDMDKEDHNPTTPTSSPYTLEPEKATAKINLETFDVNLLSGLVHYGLNEIRQRKGLLALDKHPILKQAAIDQNNYQIRTDNLTHYQDNPAKKTVLERVESFGGGFRMVGENVQFKGFPVRSWGNRKEIITPTYVEAAEAIIQNWVNSPGHYKNMVKTDYKSLVSGTLKSQDSAKRLIV